LSCALGHVGLIRVQTRPHQIDGLPQ
jgi:hypothetical protein